ncbi:MAG: EpsG family protein [Muribaculaceae bacterium]|nr:EpsG family protein [Muribaculaceae bacterium]
MILSLISYAIVGLFMYLFGDWAAQQDRFFLHEKHCHPRFWSAPIVLSIGLFTLFYGMRASNTGVDTAMYVKFYEQFCHTGTFGAEKEPLYTILMAVLSFFNAPTWIYLGSFGFLMITFVYLAVKNERYLLPYMGAFIVLGPIFLFWANGMRQCLVGCVFIWAIKFIRERKMWHYLSVIAICYFMHKSAVILIPFYWILQLRLYPQNGVIGAVIVLLCLAIGSSPTWLKSLNILEDLLYTIGYEGYSESIETLTSGSREVAFGPSRLGILIRDIWIIMVIPKIIKKYDRHGFYRNFASLFFMGACLYNLFVNTSHIFLRPVEYFTATSVIMAPLVLYILIKEHKHIPSTIYACLLYFLSFYSTVKAYINGLGDLDHSVYNFFFLQ